MPGLHLTADKTLPANSRPHRGAPRLAAALLALLALAACGDRKPDASQVAARVNKSDITVHQINFLLQQDRGLKPEQTEAAGRRTLEALIDQELAVQKAADLKLDREPQVVQALEAARREVLARAYKERVAQGAPKPSAEELRRYYDATPALFAQRRVYSLQELQADVPAEKLAWAKERLAAAHSAAEFADALKAEGLRFSGSQGMKPAEQLPLAQVERMAGMKVGDSLVLADTPLLRVAFIQAVRQEPVAFDRASSAIEMYLGNQARRKAIDDNLKALRTAAQISYQGKFAGPGAEAGAAAAEPASPALPELAAPPAAAGSAIDPDLAKKGMGPK
ncbi:MAG: EpsD family peptidyl-prolyl cis-trans isomerase [Burkholderiaceae bacterium]